MIAHLSQSAPPRSDNSVESRREALQIELDSRRSKSERNRLGQFATPNALAIEIAQYVDSISRQSLGEIRFADPAIGTGSFYSAALAVFGRDRIQQAFGVEIDPEVSSATRRLWRDAGLEVLTGDFTRSVSAALRGRAPNLILANPPYIRHHHLEQDEKLRLKALAYEMTGENVNGLAGLYVYFLLLATAWMEDGGYAAWLIPSEFMDVNYGAAVKRLLTERVTLVRAHRFDPSDVQFGDALVSSVVLVFHKTPPPASHTVEFTFGGSLALPKVSDVVPVAVLRGSRKWTMYPRHATNDRRRSCDEDGPVLSDFFRIRRGIATGSNKFFVLERSEAERHGFPVCYLRPILPSPRHLKETLIESDAEGYPLIEPQLCVIDCDLPPRALKARHPGLWQYLETAEALGLKERYLIRKRTPWYKQEQRQPAPFLCTYMGRGADEDRPFRFIWNRSKAIATNLYLMLYPQNTLAAMLRLHPERASRVFELFGEITGHELRGEGRVYGGGLNKIEPHELGRISATAFLRTWPELSAAVERQGQLFG
jgi:predicted RNA methylase